MKTNSTRRNSSAAILLSMSLGLMMAQASYSAALPLKKFSILPGEEERAGVGISPFLSEGL